MSIVCGDGYNNNNCGPIVGIVSIESGFTFGRLVVCSVPGRAHARAVCVSSGGSLARRIGQ